MQFRFLLCVLIGFSLGASARAQTCATPTGVNKTFSASTVGQTASELSGDVTAGCTKTYLMPGYNCGGCQAPLNGAITSFNTNTGAYVYKPNPGFIGTDSFTFMVRATGSNTADSAQITVNVTVTNALTTVTGRLTDLGVSAASGKVVLILGQVADTPGGTITPVIRALTATLDGTGRFTASVYPSVSLSPYAVYNLVYLDSATGRREVIGQYEIPASTATVDLATCNCRIIEAANQARLALATRASVDALVNQSRNWDVQLNGVNQGSAYILNVQSGTGTSPTLSISGGVLNLAINCPGCSGGSLASGTAGRLAYYSSSSVVSDYAFSGAHKLMTSNFTGNGLDWKSVACSGGIVCTSTPGQLAIVGSGAAFTLNSQTGASQSLGVSNTGATAPTWNSAGNVHTLVLPYAGASATGLVNTSDQTWSGRKEFLGGVSVKAPGTLLLTDSGGVTRGFFTDYGFQHVAGTVGNVGITNNEEWTWKVSNTSRSGVLGQTMDISEFTLNNSATAGQLYTAKQNTLIVGATSNLAHTQKLAGTSSFARHLSTSGGTAALLVGSYASVHSESGNVTDSIGFQSHGYTINSNVARHIGFAVAEYQDYGTGALTTQIGFYVPYLNVGTNRYALYTEQGGGGEAAALISHGGAMDWRGITTGAAPTTAPSNTGRLYFNSSVNRFQVSEHGGSYRDLTRNRFAQNCTGTCALDFNAGQVLEVTLTGNVTTVTVANIRDGDHYSVFWKQNGTGTRTIASLGTNIKVGPGGWTSGTNTTAANAVDLMLCTASGSNLFCSYTTDVKQ